MTQLFTSQIAKQAVSTVKTIILSGGADGGMGCFKSQNIHIVVGNPLASRTLTNYEEWVAGGGILYEESIGPGYTNKYVEIARMKCFLTWFHQMSTEELQQQCPHLLTDGDTSYFGSVWRFKLPVAASGQYAVVDQAMAGCVSEFCIALCKLEKKELDKIIGETSNHAGYLDFK